jgi:hypothetical protein
MPQLTCIILWQRAATTACTTADAALKSEFEDIAIITVVVTVSEKSVSAYCTHMDNCFFRPLRPAIGLTEMQ